VMPRHLLDRRLNPPHDLGRELSARLAEPGEVAADVPLVPLLISRP
jgi:hypothetical protein